jgi:hypothetical protein
MTLVTRKTVRTDLLCVRSAIRFLSRPIRILVATSETRRKIRFRATILREAGPLKANKAVPAAKRMRAHGMTMT